MKKLIGILAILVAAVSSLLLGLSAPTPAEKSAPLTDKINILLQNLQGTSAALAGVAVVCLILGIILLLLKSRPSLPKGSRAEEFKEKFTARISKKSKALEAGFFLHNFIALLLVSFTFAGFLNGWFPQHTVGALAITIILQLLFGLIFIILFLKKEEKNLALFIPGILLFLITAIFTGSAFALGLK